MRVLYLVAALAIAGTTAQTTFAEQIHGGPGCDDGCSTCADDQASCGCGGGASLLGGCRGGCHNAGPSIPGFMDPFYNCNCNGSYNHPVPPLYTYHWPGMFKQQLMTDYHSPYRFPAIRPYTEEEKVQAGYDEPDELKPISHERPVRVTARPRTMLDHLQELYGTK